MINIFFLIIYVFFSDTMSGIELSYMLSFHCLLCIILHLIERKKDIVTPIFMFYISVMIADYGNLSIIKDYHLGNIKISSYLVPIHIDEAVKLWCISTTFIFIGYNIALKKSFSSIAIEINNGKIFQIFFWVLFIIDLQKIFLPSIVLPIGGDFKPINIFSILFFARLWTKENSKTYRLYAFCIYAATTFFALKTAFLRLDLILPTISLFIGFFIGKEKIKYLFSYRVIPFIAIILLYSSVFKTLQSNRSNFYSVLFEDKSTYVSSEESESSGTGLLERTANLSQLTQVIRLVKQNGFYNGKASEPLIAAVIPRVLWPDKPKISLGGWFAAEVAGIHYVNGMAGNSINMTVPGELYLDFGWIIVIIGSLLTGAFFCLLWNSTQFYSSQYNLTGIIFGGYMLILSLGGFAADLQIIITLISMYFTLFIIKKIAKK
jgi:hypothetical protein